MTYRNILVETIDGIGWLTVNRPAQLNALNLETIGEIGAGIRQMQEDAGVRAVVITGAGEKAFVSGADIAAMREMTPEQAMAFAERGHCAMRSIEECRVVVIAAVNGYALGGGTELALACDIVIASERAKFGLPEVKLGLYPGFGGTQRLPRRVGSARARELIFTGCIIDAAEACVLGLVNRVVPAAALMGEATSLAKEIMANGPMAVAMAKRLIREGEDLSLTDALERERRQFSELFHTEDRKEGLSAFLEKRKPNFSGR